ncbi:MAG: PD40 domain-containing protein, partial [Opitutaceae bacterium]|nr:PD40 domain-containing protein [Cytophagales bacterium]
MKEFLLFLSFLTSCFFAIAQEPRMVLPIAHTNTVLSASISPNGKYVLTASEGKGILWEISSEQVLYTLEGLNSNSEPSCFSPNGKFIITTKYAGLTIWETSTGRQIHTLDLDANNDGEVISIKFSPDGKYLVAVSLFGTATIWEVETGHYINGFKEVKAAYFNNDGKYLVATKDNGTATIWETASWKIVKTFDGEKSIPSTTNFNLAGNCIASLMENGSIKIWDVNSAKQLALLNGFGSWMRGKIDISPDGKLIVVIPSSTGTSEGDQVLETQTGNVIYELKNKPDITDASFSPDGKKLAISLWDGTCKILDAKTGILLHTLDKQKGFIWRINFSHSGNHIVTCSDDKTVKVWDLNSGRLIHSLEGHTNNVKSMSGSSNGMYMVTSSENNAKVWNLSTGKLTYSLLGHSKEIKTSFFNADDKYIITASSDNTVKVWETSTSNLFHSFYIPPSYSNAAIYSAKFSHSSKYIIAGAYGNTKIWAFPSGKEIYSYKKSNYNVWFTIDDKFFILGGMGGNPPKIGDMATGEILYTLPNTCSIADPIVVSKTGKYIVIVDPDRIQRVFETATGLLISSFKEGETLVESMEFSQDEKYIATGSTGNYIKIWETMTGKFVKTLYTSKRGAFSIRFSNNGQYIAMASFDNCAVVWNFYTGKLLYELCGHTTVVNEAQFTKDDKFLITASHDSKCKIWNLKTGKEIYAWTGIDSIDYLSQIPSGYYQTTTHAAKLIHYVTKDLKVITFDQLDVKYNRPDKVLEAIGNTDTLLINSYRKAYQKRIKKLGIDTTQFKDGYSVPESDFINRDVIEYEQTKDKLTLKIKGNDSSYKLDRFNVWVNEVPLFGLRGINISKKNRNSFDTALTITLSQGENRIETSVINVNGTESYRMPLFVKYTAPILKETKLHFIGIGINQFANVDYNLSWSVKDIRDLSFKLKSKYPNIIIDTLFDKDVTKENVLALKKKLLLLNEDDKVIISYSGHGVLSKELDYYLSTYSINFDSPEEKGLAYDDLESLLDNIKPRQKMMFIDACHSGEVDKDEIAKIEASKKSLDSMGTKSKSTIKIIPNKNLGMANSFELMQSLFVNVGKGTGATIISAAG